MGLRESFGLMVMVCIFNMLLGRVQMDERGKLKLLGGTSKENLLKKREDSARTCPSASQILYFCLNLGSSDEGRIAIISL